MNNKLEYKINCLAMSIVNSTNEINGTTVEIRQKNNDKCFDDAVSKIKEYLKSNTSMDYKSIVDKFIVNYFSYKNSEIAEEIYLKTNQELAIDAMLKQTYDEVHEQYGL